MILDKVKIAYKALEDHLADNIKIIDISKVTTISDYFLIADAKNENQIHALMDSVEENLAKNGVFPKRIEGGKSSHWVLLDYGDFVVHIFDHEDRKFYNLEKLWADGVEITL